MQSSKVPCRPGSVPWLRGNISYQAPVRARARSATSGNSGLQVRSGRGSNSLITSASASSSVVGVGCAVERLQRRLDPPGARAAALHGGLHQGTPFREVETDIGPALALEAIIAPPGRKFARPGLDGEEITAGLGRNERAAPAVVVTQHHRLGVPAPLALAAPPQRRRRDVVTVAEDVRPHGHDLADDAFDREPATVDHRIDVFDEEPTAGQIGFKRRACHRRMRARFLRHSRMNLAGKRGSHARNIHAESVPRVNDRTCLGFHARTDSDTGTGNVCCRT